jgi:hypothetical protein
MAHAVRPGVAMQRWKWIAATAQEASRAIELSEREFRITGTRAPSIRPAASAWLI